MNVDSGLRDAPPPQGQELDGLVQRSADDFERTGNAVCGSLTAICRQTVLPQLAIQRFSVEAQGPGGQGPISRHALEYVQDVPSLDFLQRRQLAGITAIDQQLRRRRRGSSPANLRRSADRAWSGRPPVRYVAQLSHIAWPGVSEQFFSDRLRQADDPLSRSRGKGLKESLGQKQDVGTAGAKGWQLQLNDVDAEEEILAEAAFFHRGLQIVVGRGHDPHVKCHFPLPPTGRTRFSSSARRSFGCVDRGISPISSKRSVPPWAWTNKPLRSARASVNAPLTCPKSSLSSRVSGRAAQLTATKGLSWRRLRR